MACLFMDSCDHYDSAQLANKWNFAGVGAAINNTQQRNGTRCIECSGTTVGVVVTTSTTLIAGTAVKTQILGSRLFSFGSLGFSSSQIQIQVGTNGDGTLYVSRGDVGAVLGNSTYPNVMQQNVYYRLEVKCTFGNAGSVEIRLNGVVAINLVGVNTNFQGSGNADVVSLWGPGGGNKAYHDDIYVLDTTGAKNNDFWGDVVIVENVPTSDGFYTEWAPLGGGTHFSKVNEIPPDGNTSYNSSSTLNQRDTYNFPNTGISGIIKAIQESIFAEKDISGDRSIAALHREGGVDTLGATRALSQNSYTYFRQVWDTDPSDGLDWTLAKYNASQFGVQVTV